MSWPDPRPGLVIRYSYLWRREAEAGREEGVKDRPCAIFLAIETTAGETTVYALPITHTPPSDPADAVECRATIRMSLILIAARQSPSRILGIRSWSLVEARPRKLT